MIPARNFQRFFAKALKQPVYAANVFCKRMTALFYYRSGSGRSSMPEAVTLFLTHRCNLRCKMCGQWGEGGVTRQEGNEILGRELTVQQLNAVIDDIARYKTSVTLFGGEPLLHPGCVELIRYVKRKGLHCLMITNGSLLERYAQGIVEAGLDELNISLDGGQELHDSIRGMPGLFARIASGVDRVNYYKAKLGVSRPLVNVQCTITKYNYRSLEQVLDVAAGLHANSLTFHNLIFLDRNVLQRQASTDEKLACSSRAWEGFVFEPGIDPRELHETMRRIRSGSYPFSVDLYPNFSEAELTRYYTDMEYRPQIRCQSPWVVAYVFPDGELRPCLNSSYSFGNVKSQRLSALWNNEPARRYRRELKAQGIFPVCCRCTELYRY